MNHLYITANIESLTKIGVTNDEPKNRVQQFSQKYELPFELIVSFKIKNIDVIKIESFIHEILNAQFFNVKFLYDKFNIVTYEKYIKDKANGYTEIFLGHPQLLCNIVTFLHALGYLELKEEDFDKILKIKTQNIENLPDIKKYAKNEGKKERLGIPHFLNKTSNILEKNNDNFFQQIKNNENLELIHENNNFFIVSNEKKINVTNFLIGNTNIENNKLLLRFLKKDYMENNILFYELAESLLESNKNISVHRGAYHRKNNQYHVDIKFNSVEVKNFILSNLEFYPMNKYPTAKKIEFCNILRQNINNGNFFKQFKIISKKLENGKYENEIIIKGKYFCGIKHIETKDPIVQELIQHMNPILKVISNIHKENINFAQEYFHIVNSCVAATIPIEDISNTLNKLIELRPKVFNNFKK